MIKSFGDTETKRIWNGTFSPKLPIDIQSVARRKLRMVNSSANLMDLKIPASNRLEKMLGDLKGMYSIRINQQWRILFKWENGNAYDVKIIDYH